LAGRGSPREPADPCLVVAARLLVRLDAEVDVDSGDEGRSHRGWPTRSTRWSGCGGCSPKRAGRLR